MKGLLMLNHWETPATVYRERQVGNYRLHKTSYPAGHRYSYYFMDGYGQYETVVDLPMTLLQEYRDGEWHDWMIDDPINYRAMQKYAEAAEGDVLTTGLGLGLIVHELNNNPKVHSITVVECSPQVCELVLPYVPLAKVNLILADFWAFMEVDTVERDMVIVDLWVSKGKEQHDQVFRELIRPANELLRAKYPKAKIVIHGFQDVTDVQLVMPYQQVWGKVA